MKSHGRAIATVLIVFALSTTVLKIAAPANVVPIDVTAYFTPNINGDVTSTEYPQGLTVQDAITVRACENGSYLFLAFVVLDATQSGMNDNLSIAFEVPRDNSSSLTTDDRLIEFFRDGSFGYFYGILTSWTRFPSVPKGLICKVLSAANYWSIEVGIPYHELKIRSGENKTLGFAIFQRDGNLIARNYPSNASNISPQTWTSISSSTSWAVPDLSIRVTMDPYLPRTNGTVKFLLLYQNEGGSPVSGITLNMTLDGNVLHSMKDNASLAPGVSRTIDFIWLATFGQHNVSCVVSSPGVDANKANNAWERTFEVTNLSLTIRGPTGLGVSVDGYGDILRDGVATFYVPVGYRRIACNTTYKVDYGTKLRFVRWMEGDQALSRESSMSLLMTNDRELNIEFETWYQVTFSFKDAYRRSLAVSNYTVVFDNGSYVVFREPIVWVKEREGMRLIKVYWEGAEVLGTEIVQGGITAPLTLDVTCKVYDLTLSLYDPLGLPLSRAKLVAVFANGTTVNLETDDAGVLRVTGVPLGVFRGNITSFGLTQSFALDASKTPSTKIMVRFSMYVFILFAIPAIAVALLVLFLVIRKGQKKTKRTEERRETATFGL